MNIRVSQRAIRQISEGAWFYEKQSPGLGKYFRDHILADIRHLEITAGVHEVNSEGLYRLVSRRFPYNIYYLIEKDEVVVYAVLDSRRDPDWIREQLD